MIASQDDLDRVRRGWAVAAGLPDRTAQTFYATLFAQDPSTKPLFRGDLALQGRKLVDTLGFIVDHLDAPDRLMPAARFLAIRHVGYGVTAAQYLSVGTALITTLRTLLGSTFSDADEAAWRRVYSGLSDAMIAAAYPGQT